MSLFLVYCKDGSRWIPMGLSLHEGVGPVLFSDGPFTLFKTQNEAEGAVINAAAYHEDSIDSYRVNEVSI